MRGLLITAGLGALLFIVGLFVAQQRAWGGYLMGFFMFTGLAVAGAFFISVLTLASARWATAMRRVPEAMTTALPFGLALGLVLLGGIHSLYEWSHSSVVESDALLQGKSAYLNWGFFSVRLVGFFLIWIWLAHGMVAASRRQDADGDPELSRRRFKFAALWLPIFAVTFSLASVDWVQSIEPHWFSTIYGLVTLSGVGTSGLAVGIILIAHLRRQGPLRGIVNRDHLDDLGKIAIGFALFWGYIWYCQYMVIWYTDMPEETPYYVLRMSGGWKILTWTNVTLNWGVPFFILMPKAARRSATVLVRVAWVMLVGQALNLYLLVAPGLQGEVPQVGLWEIGPVVGAVAFFFWATLRGLTRASLVPEKDPHLVESLHYHC